MQTFLPYSSFDMSARCLDMSRLGKQRVEVLQILKTLNGEYTSSKAWNNHPAVRMWRGKELALIEYGLAIVNEWTSRGYKDTCGHKIASYIPEFWKTAGYPHWLGNGSFHLSHQSVLIRKDSKHYRPIFGSEVPNNLNYVWPV